MVAADVEDDVASDSDDDWDASSPANSFNRALHTLQTASINVTQPVPLVGTSQHAHGTHLQDEVSESLCASTL